MSYEEIVSLYIMNRTFLERGNLFTRASDKSYADGTHLRKQTGTIINMYLLDKGIIKRIFYFV